jgi:hypothetical protein
MSRMISSDQRSPSISTEAFSGHSDRRFGPDLFRGVFGICAYDKLLLAFCK